MRVGTLKSILNNVPDDYQVIFSIDAEGNQYKDPLEVAIGMYEPYDTLSYEGDWFPAGTIGNPEYDQPGPNAKNAVCIIPVN